MKQSKKWSFNKADFKRVVRNGLIFLAPVAVTLLTMLQAGDGNFDHYKYAFEVWLFGVMLDGFRKLQAGR